MARKTANDYQKEYTDKVSKLKGLEARIKARAIELCEEFPTAEINNVGNSAKDFLDLNSLLGDLDTVVYIQIIRKIEEDNAKNFPHVQTTMFPKS